MNEFEKQIRLIQVIIDACENVQNSQESRYTKQCAIETAYEQIRKIISESK